MNEEIRGEWQPITSTNCGLYARNRTINEGILLAATYSFYFIVGLKKDSIGSLYTYIIAIDSPLLRTK
jgi:hypothetical protein